MLGRNASRLEKQRIRESYERHMQIVIEERRHYWDAKRLAIEKPDNILCIIVDGMDQNTTMVPKFQQPIKGIEGRYMKTHLCGVLVHGLALYCHIWLDAHHKHDSNQVIMSIVRVLGDVRSRRGTLPPTLRIQANNCARENKKQVHVWILCNTCGIGAISGPTVVLDRRTYARGHRSNVSIISRALKRQDILSLKQMLALVEGAIHSSDEAFTSAELLENIWDWSDFIRDFLHTGVKQ